MRFAIALAAAVCLLPYSETSLLAGESSKTESGGGGKAGPVWGKPVKGLRAGLSAQKRKFDAGDRDWVRLVLHLRNEGKEKVVLPFAGAEHGWRWQFTLVGGGKPFIPRWDDDADGQRAPPPNVVLEPGTARTVRARFRQRSFTKSGSGVFCALVPGKYCVSACYVHSGPARAPKGSWRGKLTTGTVEIEIATRGDAWDTVATADASTLVALLGNNDRQLATAATAFLTEKGKGALPALTKGLLDPHAGVRAASAHVLGRLRKDAEPATTALAKALTDTDPHVRVKAAAALGWIGKGAKAAVPALVRAVKEDRSNVLPSVRPAAAAALGWIGDARPEVVAALAQLLKDKILQTDSNRYAAVAYALGRLGPKAKDAVPVLAELLQDRSNRQRRYVLRALGGIGPGAGAAVPALIGLLEDDKQSMRMRMEVASTLRRMGAAAKEAVPALQKLRDSCRTAPRDDSKARLLSDVADSAIKEIQKAKPPSPAKSTHPSKGR